MEGSGLRAKRVVLVGGSSGLGLAVAEQAIGLGAEVVIASSNAQRVQEAAAKLGPQAEGLPLDVSDEGAVEGFFQKVGSFDHLVYTAGDALSLNALATADLKKARHAFELRYWGTLAAVKYAHKQIRAGGSIVLTSGNAGLRPQKGWAFGASVCGAMDSLTRALAVELAPVRVNAVAPGVVRTDLWQNFTEQEREGLYAAVAKSNLVGRVGEASDIAKAYVFLMEEGYSTGQIVVVDGGAVLM